MTSFQFHGEVDFVELNPVAYAPALGGRGLTTCRRLLTVIEAALAPRGEELWGSPYSGQWFTTEWARRATRRSPSHQALHAAGTW